MKDLIEKVSSYFTKTPDSNTAQTREAEVNMEDTYPNPSTTPYNNSQILNQENQKRSDRLKPTGKNPLSSTRAVTKEHSPTSITSTEGFGRSQ